MTTARKNRVRRGRKLFANGGKEKRKRKPAGGVTKENRGRKLGSGAGSEAVEVASRMFHENPNIDFRLKDIVVELMKSGVIPGEVYQNAVMQAVTAWTRLQLQQAKINIGTEERPVLQRRFAVYYKFEQNAHGEEKEVPMWKDWTLLNRNEMRSAMQHLENYSRRVRRETKKSFKYCNRLLRERGEVELTIDDLLLDD